MSRGTNSSRCKCMHLLYALCMQICMFFEMQSLLSANLKLASVLCVLCLK